MASYNDFSFSSFFAERSKTGKRVFAVPPEPPVLYAARATSSSLAYHWRLTSNGDAPITGYTVTYHLHPGGPYKQVTIPRHTTSYYLNVSVHTDMYLQSKQNKREFPALVERRVFLTLLSLRLARVAPIFARTRLPLLHRSIYIIIYI